MKRLRIIPQIALLWGFSLAGSAIVHLLHAHIPGSLIGLVLLFFLLRFRVVKVSWVEIGATWLIAELLLFYVPSAVGIVNYEHLLQMDGLRIVLVIGFSTVMVMGITGLIADRLQFLRRLRMVRRKKAQRRTARVLTENRRTSDGRTSPRSIPS